MVHARCQIIIMMIGHRAQPQLLISLAVCHPAGQAGSCCRQGCSPGAKARRRRCRGSSQRHRQAGGCATPCWLGETRSCVCTASLLMRLLLPFECHVPARVLRHACPALPSSSVVHRLAMMAQQAAIEKHQLELEARRRQAGSAAAAAAVAPAAHQQQAQAHQQAPPPPPQPQQQQELLCPPRFGFQPGAAGGL